MPRPEVSMKRALSLTLALLLLVACESNGEAGKKSTPRDGKPGETGGGSSGRKKPTPRPGTGEEFTAEERATMELAWKAFKEESPDWPLSRDDWVALGPKATNTLIENLFRVMVAARIRNSPKWYDLSRRELILLGPTTVPTLSGILEDGRFWDPATKQDRALPAGVVTDVVEILVAAGPSAVEPLIGLLTHENATVRRKSAVALGQIRDPKGLAPLTEMLRTGKDWADRMTAAQALSYFRSPTATKALVTALDDPDESVVKEAARSLARMGARSALPALDARRRKARAAENHRLSAALGAAANAIRGAK
jgi:hypothetical protein